MKDTSSTARCSCKRDSNAAGEQASSVALARARISAGPGCDEHSIAPSEGERIGHYAPDLHPDARLVGNEVEIAIAVRLAQMHGGGQELFVERGNADGQFERAGSTEQMTVHTFSRADRETVCTGAEHCTDGAGLGDVAGPRRDTVSVEIVDLFWREAGVGQSLGHGCRLAVHVRDADVRTVCIRGESKQFAQHRCATRSCGI